MTKKQTSKQRPIVSRNPIIDLFARMFGTAESARERRMSFRRLKRRYYENGLSHVPSTFAGRADLRGRYVKQRSDLEVLLAEVLAVTHLVNTGSTCGCPLSFYDERSRLDGSIPHQK